MKRRQVIAIIALDVVVLLELGTAMYFASGSRDDFTLVFLKVFFGLLAPTLLLSRLVMKKIRSSES